MDNALYSDSEEMQLLNQSGHLVRMATQLRKARSDFADSARRLDQARREYAEARAAVEILLPPCDLPTDEHHLGET